MVRICEEAGGLGVAVAHSGTTHAVLPDTTAPDCSTRLVTAAQRSQEPAGM